MRDPCARHSTAMVDAVEETIAVAVDNSRAMVERARERIEELGSSGAVAVVQGDITALDVAAVFDAAGMHPTNGGFDVAAILLGTAAHLITDDDAIACLRGAAAAVAPGGIVVLELEHPFDIFDGSLLRAEGDAWDRDVDGAKVLVEWGREGDFFDVERHVVERTVGFNVVDAETGAAVDGWPSIEETVTCRIFTAPEVALLARLAGLELVATYGDMNADVSLNADDAHNMVCVLKKPE